jgi:hypothetical protein
MTQITQMTQMMTESLSNHFLACGSFNIAASFLSIQRAPPGPRASRVIGFIANTDNI